MVQQYYSQLEKASSDAEKERAQAELALFCSQNLEALAKGGCKDLILLGKPPFESRWQWFSGPLQYYHMDGGKFYVGFPIPTRLPERWMRREIKLYDIQLNTFAAKKLLEIATKIEKAVKANSHTAHQ